MAQAQGVSGACPEEVGEKRSFRKGETGKREESLAAAPWQRTLESDLRLSPRGVAGSALIERRVNLPSAEELQEPTHEYGPFEGRVM